MKKTAFLIMVITVFSKLLGFSRELVLSYFYGASAISDAYLISQTIPVVIFNLIGVGITTSYIAMYSHILKEEGRLRADKYTSNLSNVLLLLATAIAAFVLFFTQPIVKIFATGFTDEILRMAVIFTRINVFRLYFTALLSVFTGYLRLHDNFLVPAFVGFPMNLIVILSLFISARTNVYVLVIGTVLATGAQLALIIPFVRKTGYRHHLFVDFGNRHMKKMTSLAVPVILGRSVSRINILVDRTLASSIAIGGISALNYASRLNAFVQGLFVDSITTVLYPNIAKMAAEENIEGLKKSISEAIGIINLVVIPATVGAMLFSKEIVSLLFGRGAFSAAAIEMTGISLFYYSISMLPSGLRSVTSRPFYAYRDTKTPMINSIIGIIINVVLNFVFSRFLGIGGLALATSCSAIVTSVLMFITLRKKIGPFGLMETMRSIIKITAASVGMGLTAYLCFNFAGHYVNQNVALILTIITAAIVYGFIIYFMKIPEADQVVKIIKKKISGNFEKHKREVK